MAALKKSPSSKNQWRRSLGELGLAMTIPFMLVAATLVGVAIGYGVDHLFATAPYGRYTFLFLGFCAGILEMVQAIKKLQRMQQDQQDQERFSSKD